MDGPIGTDEENPANMKPYTEVVLKHLGLTTTPQMKQPQSLGQESSSDDEDEVESGGGRKRGGRGRGAKKGAAKELKDQYYTIWSRAIQLEFQEEWEESNERLKAWSRSRLEQEGFALFDLMAIQDGSLYRDSIVKLFIPNEPLPYHNFSLGDIVLLTPPVSSHLSDRNGDIRLGGMKDGPYQSSRNARGIRAGEGGDVRSRDPTPDPEGDGSIEAIVLEFSSRWIKVALPSDKANLIGDGAEGWRMDVFASTVSYERSKKAIEVMSERGDHDRHEQVKIKKVPELARKEKSKSSSSTSAKEGKGDGGGGSYLLQILLGDIPRVPQPSPSPNPSPPPQRNQRSSIETMAMKEPRWMQGQAARERLAQCSNRLSSPNGPAGDLNRSQLKAIASSLSRTLTLWQASSSPLPLSLSPLSPLLFPICLFPQYTSLFALPSIHRDRLELERRQH